MKIDLLRPLPLFSSKKFLIRELVKSDADAFIQLKREIFSETNHMLLQSLEVCNSVLRQEEKINYINKKPNSLILAAEVEGQLVGYTVAIGADEWCKRHSVYIAIGVLQRYTGCGIGTKLLDTMERWAVSEGLTRIELIVTANNFRAIKLYKRLGFRVEGNKQNARIVDGAFLDEVVMAKLLTPAYCHHVEHSQFPNS